MLDITAAQFPALVKKRDLLALTRREFFWILLSITVGIIDAYYLCSPLLINYANPNLALTGDWLTSIALQIFRYDSWHWPLTYTNMLLYPSGTTMVNTDSFPLLAVIVKIF